MTLNGNAIANGANNFYGNGDWFAKQFDADLSKGFNITGVLSIGGKFGSSPVQSQVLPYVGSLVGRRLGWVGKTWVQGKGEGINGERRRRVQHGRLFRCRMHMDQCVWA